MSGFDYEGAKAAGYSDAEINAFLTSQNAESVAGQDLSPEAGRVALERSGDPRFAPGVNAQPETNTWQRIVGQGAQHFNDTVADTATAPLDASAWVSRKLGLVPENTPRPSDVAKAGIDYVATAPGRVGDAMTTGSAAPLTDSRTSRFEAATPGERLAGDVGGGVGSVFGSLIPLGLINKAVGGAGKVGSVTSALSANPGMQAVSNVAGNVVGDVTGNPLLGSLTSMATPLGAQGARRVVSAAPATTTQEAERRGLLEYGSSIGAPQTAGKILGSSKLQAGESTVSKLPLPGVGGRVEATEAAGRNAYQRTALEKAGTYGETAATPEVLKQTRERIGSHFDQLENGTTVNFDQKMASDLANARAGFSQQLESQMPKDILKKLDELSVAANTPHNPAIDGTTYKNIRSKLSAQLATASGTDKQAVGDMINALDGAAERSLPQDMVKGWQQARQHWRNYLALEKAVSANNAQTAIGNFSPAAYAKAARGNPDIERLGRYGAAFVGDKIPNSGTPERMGWSHLLGAGAGLYEGMQHAPGMTAAAGAAAALPYGFDLGMNNPMTRALLLSRYRNASPSMLSPGLFGSLAGQQAVQNSR